MALTITSNLTDWDVADVATNWELLEVASGSGINTDEYLQGNGCYSGQTKTANTRSYMIANYGSNQDLSNQIIRVWARFSEIAKYKTQASGGISVYIEDGSGNFGEWYVGGSDITGSDWNHYFIDINTPFDFNSGTVSKTTIRKIGISVNMNTKPARAHNVFVDAIRYGPGLTITGTNTITGDGFNEIADADENVSNQYGILRRESGVFVLRGKLVFGDSASTGSVDFTDNKNSKIIILNNESVGGTMTNANLFKFEIVGNGTGTTDFELGSLIGTGDARQGILGGIISAQRSDPDGLGGELFEFDAETDTSDIDSCNLYGVTFENAGTIKMSGSTTQEAIGCTFLNCDQVEPNTAEFLNNAIIEPKPDRGLEMVSSHNTKLINFLAGSNPDEIVGRCWRAYSGGTTFAMETRDINDSDTNDVQIIDNGAIHNAGYFGTTRKFAKLKINTSTARVGGVFVWEYYNGSTWSSLTNVVDGTNAFSTTGLQTVTFDIPSDWAPIAVKLETPLYYVRLRCTSIVGFSTNPLLQQGWIADTVEHHLHFPTAGSYTSSGLDFIGHPAGGFPKWHIENSSNATSTDSYPDTNQDATQALGNGTILGVGQSITGDGGVLSRVRLHLSKTGTPTGNAVAKIYTHSGTFGTSSVPTGDPLATSENLDVSDLTTTLTLTDLEFKDEFTLVNTTKYVVALEYSGGDGSNYVNLGVDTSSPTHGGNLATLTGTTWSAASGTDLIFYVYTGGIVKLTVDGNSTPSTYDCTGSPPGTVIIVREVDVLIHAIDALDNSDVQNARAYLEADTGGALPVGTTILTPESQLTDANGEVNDTFNYVGDQPVVGRVRRGTNPVRYKTSPISGTITTDGFSATAALVRDE
jgi:hypothetical protein